MKINRLSLVAALALGSLLACTTLVSAQDAPKGKKGGRMSVEQRVDRLTKDLSLTDDQKTKVTAALEDETAKMRELRGDTSLDQQQRRDKMVEIRKGTDKKMKEILKPDQWEKYQKIQEEMRQRAKGAQGGNGGAASGTEKKDK
jgi:Spy/CpxP family protein refolding chaperone